MKLYLSIYLLGISLLTAQDGGQLYAQYCSACHGVEGKGVSGGFPPLALSEWVAGPPELATKIVLHGLKGKIQVRGENYDLMMPPQGAILDDAKVAAILTYVRKNWGNKASAVKPALVAKIRKKHAKKTELWEASDLLKDYKIIKDTGFINVISKTYSFKKEDFKKDSKNASTFPKVESLKPLNHEEEADGIIDINDASLKNNFVVTWDGLLKVPKTGQYIFILAANAGAEVLINGKKEIQTPIQLGDRFNYKPTYKTLNLKKGTINLSVRMCYTESRKSKPLIHLGWRNRSQRNFSFISREKPLNVKPMFIKPSLKKTAIYKNFIDGTSSRAVALGFSNQLNMAYSIDNANIELLWTGGFIDARKQRSHRGIGLQPPSGDNVIKLANTTNIPDSKYKGYVLDDSGAPTFVYSVAKGYFKDAFSEDKDTLIRNISTSKLSSPLELVLFEKVRLKKISASVFTINDLYGVQVRGALPESTDTSLRLKLPATGNVRVIYSLLK